MYSVQGFSGYHLCLTSYPSEDYWSDCGIGDSVSVLNNFTEEDWRELATTWMDQPASWRIRCAQTLHASPTERVGSILLAMLTDPEGEVVVEAVQSLQFLDLEALAISSDDVASLLAAYDRVGHLDREAFRVLFRELLLIRLRDSKDEAVVEAVKLLESMKLHGVDELTGDVARLLAVHDTLAPLAGIFLRTFLQVMPVQGNPWSTVRP
ncbi:hypothetical protein [Archangium sp.]|uniref:hypothetical protein n=1 Tax=Archangium sp. TaxID=1872627 RepID=UPI002ED8B217